MEVQNTTNNQIKCEICSEIVWSKSYKNTHIKIVNGEEKRFKCDICRKVFGWKKELKIHIINQHKAERHDCKNCGKFFAGSMNLMRGDTWS